MFNKSLKFISVIGLTILMLGSFVMPVSAQVDNLVVEFENEPLFNEVNFLPNDIVTRWAKVTNNTVETQDIAVKAIDYYECADSFCLADVLHLVITQGSTELYNDTLTNFFNVGEKYLSSVAGNGTQIQYDFNITFLPGSSNDYQGLSTYFDFMIGIQGKEVVGEEDPGGGGGGGGGGGATQDLIIFDENIPEVGETYAVITWTTNKFATSRVIYDTFSHSDISGEHAPNYGYMFSNTENSDLVTGHSMTINNLIAGTTYYFRPVSHASPEKVGIELTFTTVPRGEQPSEPSGETSSEPTLFTPPPPPPPPAGGQVAGEKIVVVDDILPPEEKEIIVVGEEPTPEPPVKGASTCTTCAWWVWLIVVILHLWTIGGYSSLVKKSKPESENTDEQLFPASQKPAAKSNNYPWLWWGMVAISLAIIYLLFALICKFPLLVTALVLLSYLVVLIAHHFIITRHQHRFWPFIPLILAIGPIAVYLLIGSWTWWLWVLILALYTLSILFYYKSLNKDINDDSWWLTALFLTLLALVLELAISLYLACILL